MIETAAVLMLGLGFMFVIALQAVEVHRLQRRAERAEQRVNDLLDRMQANSLSEYAWAKSVAQVAMPAHQQGPRQSYDMDAAGTGLLIEESE